MRSMWFSCIGLLVGALAGIAQQAPARQKGTGDFELLQFDTPITISDGSVTVSGVSINYPDSGVPYISVQPMKVVSIEMTGNASVPVSGKKWSMQISDASTGLALTVSSGDGNRIDLVPAAGAVGTIGGALTLTNKHLNSASVNVTGDRTYPLTCHVSGSAKCNIVIHYCHNGQCH